MDFSSILEAIWAYFSDLLVSFFDTFQASIFYWIVDVVFNDFGLKMGSDSMGQGLHFTTFFLTSISASIWTSLLNDFRYCFSIFLLFDHFPLKLIENYPELYGD